ncbi:CDP-alcohol phosphatidyltransferase family protein [Candidatus Woesearchaeota archaeon]|nr:CDP-alcohol phosphatidyltransferase family protein [Candidatus Woesearchaeota archaeon]
MKLKKILLIPNVLTILRILASPIFFILLLKSKIILGLTVFLIVALTDWVDGFVARRIKQRTKFGEFLDPMADKFMVTLAVIALIIGFNFPLYGLLIFSRDIISLCGSLLAHIKRKAVWKASKLGKVTTFLQVVVIASFIINYQFKDFLLAATIILSLLTTIQYFMIGVKMIKSSK